MTQSDPELPLPSPSSTRAAAQDDAAVAPTARAPSSSTPAPPESGVAPAAESPEADAEADSEAGDKALPHVDELPDPAVVDAALAQDRARLHVRINDAALRRRLFNYLTRRHTVPEADADDIVHDAMVRASCARKWPPENVSLYPWLRRYTNYQLLKYAAKSAVHESREQADEHIEQHAHDPAPQDDRTADITRIAEELGAQNDNNAQALAMLRAHADGVPIVALAVDAGIGEEAAKKRIQRFSAAVRERWAELGSAIVAACALILLIVHAQIPPPRPTPIGVEPERPLPELPAPMSAQAMRAEAVRLCTGAKTVERWAGCLGWLERARVVDPEGDRAPEVQAMRTRAEQALQEKQQPQP